MITAAVLNASDPQRHALEVLDATRLPDDDAFVDVLVGSPSIFVDDDDSGDNEFLDAVQRHEPLVFVLETVRGLAAPRHESFLDGLVEDLEDEGYDVAYAVRKVEGRNRLLVVGIDAEADGRPFVGTGDLAKLIETNLDLVAALR